MTFILQDEYDAKIPIYQAKNGKIMIPFGAINFTMSKENVKQIESSFYELEDFDPIAYQKAYKMECKK